MADTALIFKFPALVTPGPVPLVFGQVEGAQAWASSPSPLGAPASVAQSVTAAQVAAPSPLGAAQVMASAVHTVRADAPSPLGAARAVAFSGQLFFVRAQAPAILGNAQVQAVSVRAARVAAPTPLGGASALASAWTLLQAHAAAPSPLGAAHAVAMVMPAIHAIAPSPLSGASVFALTTVSAYAQAPTPLGSPAARAVSDSSAAHTLGAVTQFGTPSVVVVCYATESVQLIPFITPPTAYQVSVFGTLVAQQIQPIEAPIFGTHSVSFVTSHPATSIEASATFSVPVVRSVHEASSLEPVVFGAGDAPTHVAPASSLFGQVTFGQPTVSTVHPLGNWYAGIRLGAVGVSMLGSFPVMESIESVEFGVPYLGATIHPAMPLHAMPTFGPITIRRMHTC